MDKTMDLTKEILTSKDLPELKNNINKDEVKKENLSLLDRFDKSIKKEIPINNEIKKEANVIEKLPIEKIETRGRPKGTKNIIELIQISLLLDFLFNLLADIRGEHWRFPDNQSTKSYFKHIDDVSSKYLKNIKYIDLWILLLETSLIVGMRLKEDFRISKKKKK